ncbi:hypothetical protein ACFLUO_01235 [Chloroflexota bacterium]
MAKAIYRRWTRLFLAAMVRIQFGSPHWKHSELFFDKKALIPALQQLLASPL